MYCASPAAPIRTTASHPFPTPSPPPLYVGVRDWRGVRANTSDPRDDLPTCDVGLKTRPTRVDATTGNRVVSCWGPGCWASWFLALALPWAWPSLFVTQPFFLPAGSSTDAARWVWFGSVLDRFRGPTGLREIGLVPRSFKSFFADGFLKCRASEWWGFLVGRSPGRLGETLGECDWCESALRCSLRWNALVMIQESRTTRGKGAVSFAEFHSIHPLAAIATNPGSDLPSAGLPTTARPSGPCI
jgi:hypothetical protein